MNCDWIYQSEEGQTTDWSALWGTCIYQASTSDYLIAYFEDGETHSGLFVEMGAALAHRKQVYAVNMPKTYKVGKFAMITHFETLERALEYVVFDWRNRRDPSLEGNTQFTLQVVVPTEELPPPAIVNQTLDFAQRSLKEELIATGLNFKLAESNIRRAELGTEYAELQANLVAVAEGRPF